MNDHHDQAQGSGATPTVRYAISVRMLHPNGRGNGARRGHVMHSVGWEEEGHGYVAFRALCGYRPSYEWSEPYAEPVTCPKCLRRIAKQQKAGA